MSGYYQNEKVFDDPEPHESDYMLGKGGPSVTNPVYFDNSINRDEEVWETASKLVNHQPNVKIPPVNGILLPHLNGGPKLPHPPYKSQRSRENGHAHNYYNDFSNNAPAQGRRQPREQLPSESQV